MKKILIVDDDPNVTELLKAKLVAARGFNVVTAQGGREGLRLAETELPDLMLCDIDMPGMDGGAVAAEMSKRDTTKGIPILFVSSLVTPEDAAHGAKAGSRPLVSKRTQLPDLLKKIDEMLMMA